MAADAPRTAHTPTTVLHWRGNTPFAGTPTRTAPVYNPATGQVTKRVGLASAADVDTVVAVALAAFPG